MELYAGLDLHSRNTYIGIMDKGFNRVLIYGTSIGLLVGLFQQFQSFIRDLRDAP